jgi:hypothetical protein
MNNSGRNTLLAVVMLIISHQTEPIIFKMIEFTLCTAVAYKPF